MLLAFHHRLESEPNPEVRDYFNEYIGQALNLLRQTEGLSNIPEEKIVREAERMIMDISMEMASWFEKENPPVKTHFLPLSELIKSKPDRLRIEERKITSYSTTGSTLVAFVVLIPCGILVSRLVILSCTIFLDR